MTDDLVTWLRQQLDADERQANNLDELGGWERAGIESTAGGHVVDYLDRFTSARMLAEVDAKRRLLCALIDMEGDPVNGLTITHMFHLLAEPYADRPGYREEWRP